MSGKVGKEGGLGVTFSDGPMWAFHNPSNSETSGIKALILSM